jgi:hypothetical protein
MVGGLDVSVGEEIKVAAKAAGPARRFDPTRDDTIRNEETATAIKHPGPVSIFSGGALDMQG